MTRSDQPSAEQLRWVARLAGKPLEEWATARQYVHGRGYSLREEWACPIIAGQVLEVRIVCGYPDARTVELELRQREAAEPVRYGRARRLYAGLKRACDWLDAFESNVSPLADHRTKRTP